MKFGLTLNQYNFIQQTLKNHLGKEFKIFCFGSRANGSYKEFSDLDLMLEAEIEAETLSNLIEAFEESNLPIKVDIVQFKNFADSYKENYLKEKIRF